MKFADEPGAELRELFFETSAELLQALNEETLKLEKRPGDAEIVRVIRRTVHTLKGDSAACGLRELSELAHQFEDALSLEGAATQAAVAEIAFNAADIFTEMIGAYRSGKKIPSTKVISKRIQELTSAPLVKKARRKTKGGAVRKAAHWTEYENVAMARAQASGLGVYQVVAKIDAHCAMPIAGRQLIHNAIASAGQVLAVRPDAKSPAAAKQVEFVLASAQTAEQIAAKCKIPTIAEDVTVELLLAATPVANKPSAENQLAVPEMETAKSAAAAPAGATPATEASASSTALENILRVDAGRIDNVLNLVGEL